MSIQTSHPRNFHACNSHAQRMAIPEKSVALPYVQLDVWTSKKYDRLYLSNSFLL